MIICWDTFFDEKICNFIFCWLFRNLFDKNGFVRMYSDRKYQKNHRDILIHPTKISGVLCNFWFMIVLTSKNLVVKKKFSQDLFETQLDKKRQQDVGKIFWPKIIDKWLPPWPFAHSQWVCPDSQISCCHQTLLAASANWLLRWRTHLESQILWIWNPIFQSRI